MAPYYMNAPEGTITGVFEATMPTKEVEAWIEETCPGKVHFKVTEPDGEETMRLDVYGNGDEEDVIVEYYIVNPRFVFETEDDMALFRLRWA